MFSSPNLTFMQYAYGTEQNNININYYDSLASVAVTKAGFIVMNIMSRFVHYLAMNLFYRYPVFHHQKSFPIELDFETIFSFFQQILILLMDFLASLQDSNGIV